MRLDLKSHRNNMMKIVKWYWWDI